MRAVSVAGRLGGSRAWTERRRDHLYAFLEDDRMRVVIDLDRGAEVVDLVDLNSGCHLLFEGWGGDAADRVGGWYELFPNAGEACTIDGRAFVRHGDIRAARWSIDRRDEHPARAGFVFSARSTNAPLRITRSMHLDDGLHVRERIVNESDADLPYLWGHHLTFGRELMTADCEILVPDVVFRSLPAYVDEPLHRADARGPLHALPRVRGPRADLTHLRHRPHDAMLVADVGSEAWFGIRSSRLGLTLRAEWDHEAFPSLWYWRTTRGTRKKPDLVAHALEPQSSSVPILADAVRAGKAPVIRARGARTAWLTLSLNDTLPREPATLSGRMARPARSEAIA